MSIFDRFFDANKKETDKLSKVVVEVNSLEKKIQKLTDKQLKDRADDLRKKAQSDENLNLLLPEAFALVREASLRTNKERHFDVQIMAGAALHQGKIAEQKTGEGKTLTASLPVFLNSLEGRGVHVVTVNDYLARRDAGWMGPIYHLLGASVGVIIHDESFIYDPKYSNKDATDPRLKHLKSVSRKEAYSVDITYGTNNEFGFDYLKDNMALVLDAQSQRGHNFAIVDEVDSILIDEARTPLIISQPAQEPTEKYTRFDKIIKGLNPEDYVIDEKLRSAHLTEAGTLRIEKSLGVDNLYEKDFATLHHLEEALKANTLFQKDKDYVVRDGEVIIVDEFTGRLMPGRRYSEGLHQAIEAKEGVIIQQESQTLATISFQNYFRMYQKLAGMTGTAATEAEEFHKIYNLEVVVIPTNNPSQRQDHSDAIYKTVAAKYTAVANEVAEVHSKGQPILVGTTSIEKNEFLSDLLKKKGVSHALLNAKNHEKEAEIISKAGEKGAVTVATNLAGRGVDIKLGKGVSELGGLYVLGTERHESRRIDNQLRGRSGRQGDPGTTKFFVSLEDDLMRIFGGDQVARVMTALKMPEDLPIEHGMVSRAIESAQKKVEGHNFDIRKHTVDYDDVMNQQRQIIYGVRQKILEGSANSQNSSADLKDEILQKVDAEISNIVAVYSQEVLDPERIVEEYSTIINFDPESKKGLLNQIKGLQNSEQMNEFLVKLSRDLYEQKEKQIGTEITRQMESVIYLRTIDRLWIEHLDTVDDLRAGINLRGYAQRDPLVEYKREAFDLFEKLMANIDSSVVHQIYHAAIENQTPITVSPVVSAPVEKHIEALDESQLMEELGQLVSETDKLEDQDKRSGDAKVKVEGSSNDSVYNGHPGGSVATDRILDQDSIASLQNDNSGTKVTIERDGQVIDTQIKDDRGSLQQKKPGRNDPCWCGSGKKYKKCHYPN